MNMLYIYCESDKKKSILNLIYGDWQLLYRYLAVGIFPVILLIGNGVAKQKRKHAN